MHACLCSKHSHAETPLDRVMLWGHNCSDGNYPLSLAIDINERVLLANATAGAKVSASPASWPSRFEFENPASWCICGRGKVDWILFRCWCLMSCRGCERKKKSRKPITKQIVSFQICPRQPPSTSTPSLFVKAHR
jgi:hypothetical protein